MSTTPAKPLHECLRHLLLPVVRFCVRRAIKVQDFIEITKAVYLEVARAELENQACEASASRLNVMTGVHRIDIARLRSEGVRTKDSANLIGRVLGHWQRDLQFCTKGGEPRTLTMEGIESEFAALVRSVHSDLNPYTVLFELERIGAVERTRAGLRLRGRSFVVKGDVARGFSLLSADCSDLLRAVEENVEGALQPPHLHLKTEYDAVVASAVPRIKAWLIDQGEAFHRRARAFLSRYDRDLNRSLPEEPTVRVAVGAFSFVEEAKAAHASGNSPDAEKKLGNA